MSSLTEEGRAAQIIANRSSVPTNVQSLDNINTVTRPNSNQIVNSSFGGQTLQNLQQSTPQISSQTSTGSTSGTPYAQQLTAAGITFNPIQNPLNVYANYTYHVRFSLLGISASYAQDGTYATMNGTNKIVIAESGVTAGFNITDFEYKNTCAPGRKILNTTSTTWTMTVAEPFGMSLIDKMFGAGAILSIDNWSRAPYFIEVWFNGYNEDGTIMAPTLHYTQYRVILLDIDVKVTEGGSVYSLSGVFDGDIGHSNEISIPPAKFQIKASTVGEFFQEFQDALNASKPNNINENAASPLTKYIFNVPSSIATWPFKISQIDDSSQRTADMVTDNQGYTTFNNGKGESMENVVNAIIGTCPQVATWIQGDLTGAGGSLLTQSGIATWILVHSYVQLTNFNTTINDYNRQVVYNLIPYNTVIGITDRASVEQLQQPRIQKSKLNYLASTNALVKEYDYIYTGLNTEIIKYDISIDNAWQIALPQWSALNSYYNMTAPPLVNTNNPGYTYLLGEYNTNSGSGSSVPANPTNLDNTAHTQYAEDVQTASTNFPFPLVVRQQNIPQAHLADNGQDANPAIGNKIGDGKTAPMSRALGGTFLQNLFGNAPSFMNVELEIRGDPYWMGNGNVVDDAVTAINLVNGNVPQPYNAIAPAGQRASYLASSTMFILSFRTGENYNEATGLMQFDSSSQFYNGAYVVTEVTNTFRQGSFTQTLSAYKDPLSQSAILPIYNNTQVGKSV